MNKKCKECEHYYDCKAGIYVKPPCMQDDDLDINDEFEMEDY